MPLKKENRTGNWNQAGRETQPDAPSISWGGASPPVGPLERDHHDLVCPYRGPARQSSVKLQRKKANVSDIKVLTKT